MLECLGEVVNSIFDFGEVFFGFVDLVFVVIITESLDIVVAVGVDCRMSTCKMMLV